MDDTCSIDEAPFGGWPLWQAAAAYELIDKGQTAAVVQFVYNSEGGGGAAVGAERGLRRPAGCPLKNAVHCAHGEAVRKSRAAEPVGFRLQHP